MWAAFSLRAAILEIMGYDEASVTIRPAPRRLIVTVVNSRVLDAGDGARLEETAAISAAVAQAIAIMPDFDDVAALRIDYVRHDATGMKADLAVASLRGAIYDPPIGWAARLVARRRDSCCCPPRSALTRSAIERRPPASAGHRRGRPCRRQ
jgi:hypothetical protein